MIWIRWAFLAANIIYSLLAISWNRDLTYLNSYGRAMSAILWVWQLIGVAVVIVAHLSAWLLLWWFALGYVLMLLAGKVRPMG